MPKTDESNGFNAAAMAIVRKALENIESPYVWMPLLLFVISVLAYTPTGFRPFLYFAFLMLPTAFGFDIAGRLRNRRTPELPDPGDPQSRTRLRDHFAEMQSKTIELFKKGKSSSAMYLAKKNLQEVGEMLRRFPDDAELYAVAGYDLKNMYMSSKGIEPKAKRRIYLGKAREYFERALALSPENPDAHNGMGNVLFYEGNFDEAIREHKLAIALTGGRYGPAVSDLKVVEAVKRGEFEFDP